jgi:hypothetical protein
LSESSSTTLTYPSGNVLSLKFVRFQALGGVRAFF